jgi:hypothetical protein
MDNYIAGTKLSKKVTTHHLEVNDNPMLSKEYKAPLAQQLQTKKGIAG